MPESLCQLAGGVRVRSGIDDGLPSGDADDGELQDGEVDMTNYVCDGESRPGTPGYASLVVIEEDDGTGCPLSPGIKITHGVDDGRGGGIAGNGTLEDGEIAPAGVKFVCHGVNGTTVGGGCGAAGSTSLLALLVLCWRRRRARASAERG